MSAGITDYSANAIIACAELAIAPTEYTPTVRERISYQRGEILRSVSMALFLPEPLTAPLSPVVEPVLVPILTPRKNELLTVTECRDGNDRRLDRLGHAEHVHVSQLMISELLWLTGTYWLGVEPLAATAALLDIQDQMFELVSATPSEAHLILRGDAAHEGLFDDQGRLRAIPLDIRSRYESTLYLLCSLLTEHYIVMLRGESTLGSRVTVSYQQRTAHSRQHTDRRGRVVEMFGGPAPNLRFPASLARRTNDYHFFIAAEAGGYFARQRVQFRPIGTTHQPVMSDTAGWAAAEGGKTEAHLYVTNGSTLLDHRVDIEVTAYELPLGSTGAAWAVAAITSFTLAMMLFVKWATHDVVTQSDVPALLVSFVTTGAAISGELFRGKSEHPGAVLSRLSVLASTLLGNAFAVWLLLVAAAPETRHYDGERVLGLSVRTCVRVIGPGIFVLVLSLLVWLSYRAVRAVHVFAQVDDT